MGNPPGLGPRLPAPQPRPSGNVAPGDAGSTRVPPPATHAAVRPVAADGVDSTARPPRPGSPAPSTTQQGLDAPAYDAGRSLASLALTVPANAELTHSGFLGFLEAILDAIVWLFGGFFGQGFGESADTNGLQSTGEAMAEQHRPALALGLAQARQSNSEEAFRAELRERVATGLMAAQEAAGEPIGREEALQRAGVVVEAALAKIDAMEAEGPLPIPAGFPIDTQNLPGADIIDASPAERLRVQSYLAHLTQGLTAELGSGWTELGQEAMRIPTEGPYYERFAREYPRSLGADGAPTVAGQAEILRERLQMASYVMAAARAQVLPAPMLQDIARAALAGEVSTVGLQRALSAMAALPAPERERLLHALEGVPAEHRVSFLGLALREGFGLASSSGAEREATFARLEAASEQLSSKSPSEIEALVQQNKLGLDGPHMVSITAADGAVVPVAVYRHPSVPRADWDRHVASVQAGLGSYPAAVLRQVAAGEGGVSFSIELNSAASLYAHSPQSKPDTSHFNDVGGVYEFHDNTMHLNVDVMNAGRDTHGHGAGAPGHIVRHEFAHAIDDALDPRQDAGATGALGERDTLINVHSQFEVQRREDFIQGRGKERSGAGATFDFNEEAAQAIGIISPYATARRTGQNGALVTAREFFAEAIAHYADPEGRAQMKAVNPVLAQAIEEYFAHPERGLPLLRDRANPLGLTAASRDAMSGGRQLNAEGVALLESTADALEVAGRGYRGWRPPATDDPAVARQVASRNRDADHQKTPHYDAGSVRSAQRDQLINEGRQIATELRRRAALTTDAKEARQLEALAARFEGAVAALEATRSRGAS